MGDSSNSNTLNSSFKDLEINRRYGALPTIDAGVFTHEKDGYVGRDSLDDLGRIFPGEPEWFRINNDKIILFEHDHVNGRGWVFDGVHLISFVSQYAVEVFYQNGIG